jgi:hypothetical protein
MQVLAFNSRVVLRPTVRVKIKRRLKEAVKLIVTRGAAVEESRKGPRVVFRSEDVGADKWISPGVFSLLFHAAPNVLSFRSLGGCYSRWAFAHRLDVYCFAHIGDVPHVVCGIGQFNASSTRVSSSVRSRS